MAQISTVGSRANDAAVSSFDMLASAANAGTVAVDTLSKGVQAVGYVMDMGYYIAKAKAADVQANAESMIAVAGENADLLAAKAVFDRQAEIFADLSENNQKALIAKAAEIKALRTKP